MPQHGQSVRDGRGPGYCQVRVAGGWGQVSISPASILRVIHKTSQSTIASICLLSPNQYALNHYSGSQGCKCCLEYLWLHRAVGSQGCRSPANSGLLSGNRRQPQHAKHFREDKSTFSVYRKSPSSFVLQSMSSLRTAHRVRKIRVSLTRKRLSVNSTWAHEDSGSSASVDDIMFATISTTLISKVLVPDWLARSLRISLDIKVADCYRFTRRLANVKHSMVGRHALALSAFGRGT